MRLKCAEENFPTVNTFHTLKNRELPIVFVKLDRYTGTQLSTDADKHSIVPFTECVNEIRLTVNGTHYMRWQLPLILAYSITTHKSQSMTAHKGIVYEPSKNKPFARGLPCSNIKSDSLRKSCTTIAYTTRSFYKK
jgi:hypothetical protein